MAQSKDQRRAYYLKNRALIRARSAARYAAKREAILEQQRAYRAANSAKRNTYQREYERTHPEQTRAAAARYRAKHREACRERVKAAQKKNPAPHRAATKRWRERNREKFLALRVEYTQARRAAERRPPIEDRRAIRAWIASWRALPSVRCHWCDQDFAPRACHADHVTPLAKGGAHALANLVVACADCNMKKHASEWRKVA